MLFAALRLNGGHFAYAIDDAYIHLAVSKNLTLHQLWGVTPFEFSSSSSSMVWPLLNALPMAIFGVGVIYPLVINVALSMLVVVVIGRILHTTYHSPLTIALITLTIALLIPLPALTFLGLEHILHTLLTLAFAWSAAQILAADAPHSRHLAQFVILGALLPLARYEGLFLVSIVLGLLALRGRWKTAVLIGGLVALPILAFGRYSTNQGWLFLPNSVVLKGNTTTLTPSGLFSLLQHILDSLHEAYVLTPLLIITLYRFTKQRGTSFWEQPQLLRLLFILATLAHLPFVFVAKGSHLDALRYDAYIVALGLVVVALDYKNIGAWIKREFANNKNDLRKPGFMHVIRLLISPQNINYLVIGVVIGLFTVPFALRGIDSTRRAVLSMNNVYERQVQIGRFLHQNYNGQAIVANDIGAINYYADLHLVDLVGLGTIEIVDLIESGSYDRKNFHALARNKDAAIAIIFDSWADALIGGVPKQWTLVGRWGLPNDVLSSNKFVSFYAIVPEQIEPLRQQLTSFHPSLPTNVIYGINPDLE